jgi:hypothetical protein
MTNVETNTGKTMVNGWPDILVCNVTNPAWGPNIFLAALMPYSANGLYYYGAIGNANNWIKFNANGTFFGYEGATLVTTDCNTTMSTNIAAGRTRNLSN